MRAEASLRRSALGYVLAAALSIVALALLFDLGHADLSVPFAYTGDALFYGMTTQTVLEHGWYTGNDRLGMPFGQVLLDFPVPDTLSLLLLRGLGLLSGDWATVMNLFYLVGYPLTTLAALFALRRLGVTYWPALLASLLYAFSSYHVVRGEYHLMYTSYWAVPLMVMVLLWLCADEVPLHRPADLWRPRLLGSLVVCAAIAATGGVYFPFFACALLLAVAIHAAVRGRSWRRALLPLGFLGVTFGVLVLGLLPSIVYRARHGSVGTAVRPFHDAETLGLKLVQMLLPVQGHRIPAWAALRASYDAAPVVNRAAVVSLGVLSGLGLVLAVGRLLFHRRPTTSRSGERLDHLAMLAGVALLIGTVGGLGACFAFLVSGQVRGYDRISVWIEFFAVATLVLHLDRMRARWCGDAASQHGAEPRPLGRRTRCEAAFAALVLGLASLGILDQVPREPIRDREGDARTFAAERAFFARVEATLPRGAMVFQLPRHDFPEGGTYDDLKPYLQTRELRFSGGAMHRREAARWQEHVTSLPTPRLLETVAAAGFVAVLVDRLHAYPGADALVDGIATHLGPPRLRDADGRWVLFDLAPPAATPMPESDAAARRETALHPVYVDFGPGFSSREGDAAGSWRFGQAQAELCITNELQRTRALAIDMTLLAAGEGELTIAGDLLAETVRVRAVPTRLSRRLLVPPGTHRLHFYCTGPPLVLPNDGRSVVFKVSDFAATEGD